MNTNNKKLIKYMLYYHAQTHPNICKLWLSKLDSAPTVDNFNQAKQTLTYLNDLPDLSKFEILSIYSLLDCLQ